MRKLFQILDNKYCKPAILKRRKTYEVCSMTVLALCLATVSSSVTEGAEASADHRVPTEIRAEIRIEFLHPLKYVEKAPGGRELS